MIMRRKKLTFLSIVLVLTISLVIPVNGQFTEASLKIGKVISLIEAYYVEDVNQEKMVEQAIINVLEELDPHSTYISEKEVKKMNEPLIGNFEGIGIQFNVLYDTILVISPVPGGPSEKVGIRAGDRIVKINGENVAAIGITTTKVRDKLLGEKGTKVNVSIKRKGVVELIEFTITRDKIPIHSLDAAYMANDEIGYMKLNKFSFTTMKEFHEAVDSLLNLNMKKLILDLRGNGGGYLETAVKLVDEFLPEGKMIVSMEGNHVPKKSFISHSGGRLLDNKVVVIIDEGSASASEIVAGAFQDWDRGVVIGRRSFGKGLVQRPFNLPDGSIVRLTIAKYYTPSGRLIQKPYDDGFEEYAKDLVTRYNNGEFVYADSIHFPDSLKYTTLLNQRVVYGGGGIMPDVFVPLDTTGNTGYYNDLLRKGVVTSFTLDYVDRNRDKINRLYRSFSEFRDQCKIDDSMLKDLLIAAEAEKIEKNEAEFEQSKEQIKMILKALIARDIWDISEYYEIVNEKNKAFNKAISILKNEETFFSTIDPGLISEDLH
ncbi:MAG: S41 family peptidase [Bacteroidales bacterium]|nr:S41 family peptidase [Bacteroidales bacterium]